MLNLLSQADPTPITPSVFDSVEHLLNPTANVGAFGVLLVIAVFMIRNLPRWIDQHFASMKELTSEHRREVREAGQLFASELKAEREQCDRHHQHVISHLESSNAANLKALENIGQRIADHHNFAVAQLATIQRQKNDA